MSELRWTNYHSHCNFCDGTDTPENYVRRAINDDLQVYGFSSHAPLDFDCKWCVKKERITDYVSEVQNLKQKYKDELEIYCGLEVDFIPEISGPQTDFVKNLGLDYTIGSVHFVDVFPDGKHWEIDNTYTIFLDGLNTIFGGNVQKAITRYYALTRQMIKEQCPDIIGHLDKIKMQNKDAAHFAESDHWYQEEIQKTLALAKNAGAIIELNTRGLYKKKTSDFYPSPWILERMKEMNIPVTINSDAHTPDEITGCFEEALTLLKDIGFRHLQILKNGQWQPIAIP
jgi:histidinol-phosphatase (PHP family)